MFLIFFSNFFKFFKVNNHRWQGCQAVQFGPSLPDSVFQSVFRIFPALSFGSYKFELVSRLVKVTVYLFSAKLNE